MNSLRQRVAVACKARVNHHSAITRSKTSQKSTTDSKPSAILSIKTYSTIKSVDIWRKELLRQGKQAERLGSMPPCSQRENRNEAPSRSYGTSTRSQTIEGASYSRHIRPFALSKRSSDGLNKLAGRRQLHISPLAYHGGIKRPAPGTGIKVNWYDSKGNFIKTTEGNEGDSLLDIAQEYDIDMEGACEGSVACSTCHVILNPEAYDILEEPEDDENDMLDMAFGLTDTSRLGCQVKLKPEMDGMKATLPSATRNFFVDGAKPTKH